MVKLMILVVLLVALIALTRSAPQAADQDLEKEYEEVVEQLLEKEEEKAKQDDPPYGYSGYPEGYVCCNSPPRIPNRRKTRGHAYNLIKRAGIGYGGARSVFGEFPRRNAIAELPQEDSFDSIDTEPYGSSRASTLALVKRLMTLAKRKRVAGASLRNGMAMDGVDEPLMMVNYPRKRKFIGAPSGPGGNNLGR